MDNSGEDPLKPMFKKPNVKIYRLTNGPSLQHSGRFEIRLFYVRIAPCAADSVPDHLTIHHLRRELGVSLEINGSRIPSTETTSLKLRRDRLDKESSEVTYVSTDSVKLTGAVEFEVYEKEQEMILCGSLERMETSWSNGSVGLEDDSKTGWSMNCYTASSIASGTSAFFQPKFGISAPSFEVYIVGCCSGVPVTLTKTILVSPRRKPRCGGLDAIPEDEEIEKERIKSNNGLVRQRKVQVQITQAEIDDYESDGKIGSNDYSEDMYAGEDGQLTWFNAGVRVGVGIGLGMCLGVGIGVGLLMRSYQATTRSFRRRFF